MCSLTIELKCMTQYTCGMAHGRMYVCMYVCVCVCVCVYVCMLGACCAGTMSSALCVYVCVCVCMYVYHTLTG